MNNRKELPFKTLLLEPVRNGVYKKKEFHGRGAKIVNMGELFGHPRLFDIHMKRVELSEREIPKFLLREGDLLFARRSLTAEGAGKCSIVKEIKEPTTFESSIIRARPNTEKVDSDFLYYYFDSAIGKSLLDSILRQVAVAGITGSDLSELILRIPPLSEQQKIAFILSSLDDKIALNRKLNETLERMARALFQSWFVDFDPVKAKLAAKRHGRDPERACLAAISGKLRIPAGKPRAERLDDQLPTADELDAAIAALDTLTEAQRQQLAETAARFPDEFQYSELGLIPAGWRLLSLDQVATYQNGLALQKFRPKRGEQALPIIKIAQLKSGEATWDELASASIKAECIIQDGDVVFSWSGSLLVKIWCGGKAALNQHLFKVTSENFPKWLYCFWTDEHLENFQRIAADKAVTMGHIKRSHLSDAKCVIPDDKGAIEAGSRNLDSVLEQIISLEKQSRTLAELRDTLLPKLLSGELSVSAAKDAMEEAVAS